MKKQILNLFFATSLLVIGSTSCKKKGCTDAQATNYTEEAKKDDGTCTFKSTLAFYLDQSSSTNLINAGITEISIYVDNINIGSMTTSQYFDSTPECGANGTLSFNKDLGENKTAAVSYKIYNNSTNLINNLVWDGVHNLQPNCEAILLEY